MVNLYHFLYLYTGRFSCVLSHGPQNICDLFHIMGFFIMAIFDFEQLLDCTEILERRRTSLSMDGIIYQFSSEIRTTDV